MSVLGVLVVMVLSFAPSPGMADGIHIYDEELFLDVVQFNNQLTCNIDHKNKTLTLSGGIEQLTGDVVDITIADGPGGNDFSGNLGKLVRLYCANPIGTLTITSGRGVTTASIEVSTD